MAIELTPDMNMDGEVKDFVDALKDFEHKTFEFGQHNVVLPCVHNGYPPSIMPFSPPQVMYETIYVVKEDGDTVIHFYVDPKCTCMVKLRLKENRGLVSKVKRMLGLTGPSKYNEISIYMNGKLVDYDVACMSIRKVLKLERQHMEDMLKEGKSKIEESRRIQRLKYLNLLDNREHAMNCRGGSDDAR